MRRLICSALLWSLASIGCAPEPTTPAGQARAPEAIGTLHSPLGLGRDFQWRQQVTAHWPSGTRAFDAILSKDGDTLLLVGLGPMDTPGFVFRVDGAGKLTVENHTGQPIPFDPRFVLLDVQRAFYPWFPAPLADGTRTTNADGETITETWQADHLLERTFARIDGKPPGKVVVSYEGWQSGNRAPSRVVLRSGWHGYTLEIETVEQTDIN